MSVFPPPTELIVGPGARDIALSGWPQNPDSFVLESDTAERVVREISFDNCPNIGRFRAMDFFGNGSFCSMHLAMLKGIYVHLHVPQLTLLRLFSWALTLATIQACFGHRHICLCQFQLNKAKIKALIIESWFETMLLQDVLPNQYSSFPTDFSFQTAMRPWRR